MSGTPDAATPTRPTPGPGRRPQPRRAAWTHRADLPVPTLAVFVFFAAVLWLNAIVNHFRFNVVIALLGTVPVLILLARGAAKARHAS